ncbi:cystathionine gamma-lyase-like isoform X2 [Dendropsophus ebraccatus]|uniref:cystathionine gamma-lyase-like isoform X2 n=1 Tax=Dendropsophus ebraccatus TaxID=150705 RepID=UPI0038314C13
MQGRNLSNGSLGQWCPPSPYPPPSNSIVQESLRVMTTAAVETRRGTVWRKPSPPLMVPNTVWPFHPACLRHLMLLTFWMLETTSSVIVMCMELVWIETPTNPTLVVVDIQGCADIVHKYQGILLAVDNTFMSAYYQRPLSLGADICMYSATKYMNGHTDVLMGLVSVNCDKLYEKLKLLQSDIGAVPSPFECYLCNRGLKTLPLRMRQHFHNGLAVALFLEQDPRVEKVLFPGLPSHPQYELTKRQCTGVPGMVSFYVKGNFEHVKIFFKSLKVFALADSLGGYDSLVSHPVIMSHPQVPEKDRLLQNITDTLIRLSVGLEDAEDIIEDLDQALQVAHPDLTNPTKVEDLLRNLKINCEI